MPESSIATPPPAPAPAAPKPAARTPSTPPSKPAPAPSKPATPPSKPAAKPTPAPAAKVVNPFDEAFADMERFSSPDVAEPRHPASPKSPPKKEATKPAEEEPGDETAAETEEQPQMGDETKPAEEPKLGADGKPIAEKPGKTSPWKLVESYKQTNARLQKEIADLRLAAKPGELPPEAKEKFTALETRNKELEDEIRYANFSKSKEFSDTYQKPYEEAWTSAISDLKELSITNEDGTSRQASVQDLLALSNMPLGQARATAKAWFGDSADDVMAHRRTLRELSDKQTKALEDSRKNGSERDQQRRAEMEAKHKAHAEETSKVWHGINEEAVQKYEFLRPVEGETERNERLEQAVKFVDDTFKRNIGQAKTQEERDQILKSHAAVRNRAIGFSVLKHENTSLKSKVAELEKALAEFQGSEPTGGEPRHTENGEPGGDTLEGAINRMARLAS